jgi:2-polyprenyl-3-methyl-5-hydroxy-6-metoxy-1,4-benzoquinol methylase
MSTIEEKYFTSNKDLWNKRTSIHKNSDFYDLEGFKKGKNVLNEIELNELGDVSGKSILHLQCHFGLDSMSWSRLGAKVTGVDFSDNAIDVAKELNAELGLNATFICSNIYDLMQQLDQQFDIVFTSYGTIGWLPDLEKWADIIRHYLKPGGTFYLAEFHPVLWMFDDDFSKLTYSYFNSGVIETEEEGTYADKKSTLKQKEYSWNHSIGSVVNALIRHGLNIESLSEFNYSPYDCFPNTIKNEKGNFNIKGHEGVLPMVYSIRAELTR